MQQNHFTTNILGWPQFHAKLVNHNGHYYIPTTESLKFLGFYQKQKAQGWTKIDAFLTKNNFTVAESFTFSKSPQDRTTGKGHRRSCISVAAFILLISGGGSFRDPPNIIANYTDCEDNPPVSKADLHIGRIIELQRHLLARPRLNDIQELDLGNQNGRKSTDDLTSRTARKQRRIDHHRTFQNLAKLHGCEKQGLLEIIAR